MRIDLDAFQRIRRAVRPLRRIAREGCHRVFRRLRRLGGNWRNGLPEELRFWENALKDPARHWLLSEYRERMDADLELQDSLKMLIEAPPGAVVRILDVGAGPLTRLGKKWAGRQLQLFPIDPLAEDYKAMAARLNLQPPVQTKPGHGEKLLEQFQPDFFDLAYASNSLDHSYDPLLAIRQMLAVVKPRCYVYLWHFAHVGVSEGYAGLHQWNFDIVGGDMVLSNGQGVRRLLAAEFRGSAELQCERAEFNGEKVVVAKMRKRGGP